MRLCVGGIHLLKTGVHVPLRQTTSFFVSISAAVVLALVLARRCDDGVGALHSVRCSLFVVRCLLLWKTVLIAGGKCFRHKNQRNHNNNIM